MIENYRTIAIILVMTLCIIDLAATYHYIYKYKKWQPEKPYNLIELNPLLRFLWGKFGLHLGMFIASVIILTLNYIIAKEAHWAVVVILLGVLIFTMFNHFSNTVLLYKLIGQYPSGHLPTEVFGVVEGNNPK